MGGPPASFAFGALILIRAFGRCALRVARLNDLQSPVPFQLFPYVSAKTSPSLQFPVVPHKAVACPRSCSQSFRSEARSPVAAIRRESLAVPFANTFVRISGSPG